jgi:hypothetical protein
LIFSLATDVNHFERERSSYTSTQPVFSSASSSQSKKRAFPEQLSRASMLSELAALPKKGNKREKRREEREKQRQRHRETETETEREDRLLSMGSLVYRSPSLSFSLLSSRPFELSAIS